MNDILVYSNTKNEHVKHVKMVLNAFKILKIVNQNRKMQVSYPGNNVFKIRYYSKDHSYGNDQNRQYPNLTGTQKHKKIAEIVGIHRILPKHDTKIRRMDIINDKFLANFFLNGGRIRH